MAIVAMASDPASGDAGGGAHGGSNGVHTSGTRTDTGAQASVGSQTVIPTSGRNPHRGGGAPAVTCTYRVLDSANPFGPGLDPTADLPEGTGMWRTCYDAATGVRVSGPTFITSGAPGAGAPDVTAQLVDQALANIDIDLPTPRVSPPRETLPNIDTWFWTDELPTQRASASAAGVTVTVTATLTTTKHRLDDGSTVVCPGPPHPYDPALPEAAQRSTCTHRFSAPTRDLTIETTATWHLTWTATNGRGGDLGTIDRTAAIPYRVQAKATVIRN